VALHDLVGVFVNVANDYYIYGTVAFVYHIFMLVVCNDTYYEHENVVDTNATVP